MRKKDERSSGLSLKMIGNFNSLKFVILMMRKGS